MNQKLSEQNFARQSWQSSGARRIAAEFNLATFGFRPGGCQNGGSLITDLRNIGQIADIRLQQILEPGQTGMDQRIRLLAQNSRNRGEQLHRFSDFFVEALGRHHFAFDVHLPARELGGQARILAPLADGERKLILAGDDPDAVSRFINLEHLELGGRKRVGNEVLPRNELYACYFEERLND